MKIKYTAAASGNGKLKSGEINEFTKNVPDDASISINATKAMDQMDNDRWTLSADWEEETSKPLKPGLNYAPGVRGLATDTANNY